MYRRDRPADNEFSADEDLYMRCEKGHVANGRLKSVAAIKFPDQSVNRSRYSRPLDLLIPDPMFERSRKWLFLGVVKFAVGDVPAKMERNGSALCEFSVEHDPQEKNYSHSELRVYKDGNRISLADKNKISKQDRTNYRLEIMKAAVVILEPLV